MTQHKTKVIALRVTEDQYNALAVMANGRLMKMGEYVYNYLIPAMNQGAELLLKERKKAEAKAKREAKKEATNGLQS
jgi:hypothetical protein